MQVNKTLADNEALTKVLAGPAIVILLGNRQKPRPAVPSAGYLRVRFSTDLHRSASLMLTVKPCTKLLEG